MVANYRLCTANRLQLSAVAAKCRSMLPTDCCFVRTEGDVQRSLRVLSEGSHGLELELPHIPQGQVVRAGFLCAVGRQQLVVVVRPHHSADLEVERPNKHIKWRNCLNC